MRFFTSPPVFRDLHASPMGYSNPPVIVRVRTVCGTLQRNLLSASPTPLLGSVMPGWEILVLRTAQLFLLQLESQVKMAPTHVLLFLN